MASPDLTSLGSGFLRTSAALNVFLDDDAAVSEHGAGHVGQEGPRVGRRLVGFHVAQGRPLAANDAARGIDLAIKHHGAVEESGERVSPFTPPPWAWSWMLNTLSRGGRPPCSPFAEGVRDLMVCLCPMTRAAAGRQPSL